jgi:deazaflavin-dependent oxidoreductase (nitroreductase family)
MPADLTAYAPRSTVRLTTVGRKSGQKRTVTIWFVVADPQRIYVQHVRGADANWYRNLLKTPSVELDFGDGPLAGHATPISDRDAIRRVLRLVRRKYLAAWLVQLLAIGRRPVAAEISVGS